MRKDLGIVSRRNYRRRQLIDLILIITFAVAAYLISSVYDLLEKLVDFSRKHETWELDEFVTVFIFLVFALLIYTIRRLREINDLKNKLGVRNIELEKALSEVKRLRGILPICANCKKIRDDAGYWHQVEMYVTDHTDAEFSHSICPDCMKKLYSDLDIEIPADYNK